MVSLFASANKPKLNRIYVSKRSTWVTDYVGIRAVKTRRR